MIEALHYITPNGAPENHINACQRFCEAGGKWVQLRMKDVSDDVYVETATNCREITTLANAKLIINDRPDIALKVAADGVHLGMTDLSTASARKELPSSMIIGGTANNIEQVFQHHNNGVDYVGVGPFRFTETKKNLSPILGIEGYRNLMSQLKEAGIRIPVIAIGGITLSDLDSLKDTGVHGIAVSGVLTTSNHIQQDIATIYENFTHETA